MIAVIKTGGKQYLVEKGDKLRVEKLPKVEEGKSVTFKEVLLVGEKGGAKTQVGSPTVKGASVEAKVLKVGRAKKVQVRKFKAKSRYTRNYGHRQPFVEVQIEKIAV